MEEFEIRKTDTFSEIFVGLEKREQEWIEKTVKKLKTNHFSGKPLRFEWFREKKFEGKRLYFFVSIPKKKILIIAFGDKKDQRKIIARILVNKEKFWIEINNPNPTSEPVHV